MILVDNFLPKETFDLVDKIVESRSSRDPETKRMGWTNLIWDTKLQKNSSLTFVVPTPELNDTLSKLFAKVDKKFEGVPLESQFCVWGRGSTIPFHNDQHVAFGATIYLNKNWNIEDGGLFLWKDHNTHELFVVNPVYNLCVINDLHEEHHVSVVNYAVDTPRLTLQVWAGVNEEIMEGTDISVDNTTFSYR